MLNFRLCSVELSRRQGKESLWATLICTPFMPITQPREMSPLRKCWQEVHIKGWDNRDEACLLPGGGCAQGGRKTGGLAIPLGRLSGDEGPRAFFKSGRCKLSPVGQLNLNHCQGHWGLRGFPWWLCQPPASLEGWSLEDQAQEKVCLEDCIPVFPLFLPSLNECSGLLVFWDPAVSLCPVSPLAFFGSYGFSSSHSPCVRLSWQADISTIRSSDLCQSGKRSGSSGKTDLSTVCSSQIVLEFALNSWPKFQWQIGTARGTSQSPTALSSILHANLDLFLCYLTYCANGGPLPRETDPICGILGSSG